MTEITLDTGLEEVRILNKKGERVASVWFNPADVGIISRAQQAVEELRNRQQKPSQPGEAVLEMEKTVKQLFDRVFGGNFADTIFEIISPLTVMEDGSCFYETLIEQLLPLMEEKIREKETKSHEHLRKYLPGA